jgi:hypothetical protein
VWWLFDGVGWCVVGGGGVVVWFVMLLLVYDCWFVVFEDGEFVLVLMCGLCSVLSIRIYIVLILSTIIVT